MNKYVFLIFLIFFPLAALFLVREFFDINYLVSSVYKIMFVIPVFYRLFIHKKSFKESLCEGFDIQKFKHHFLKTTFLALVLGILFLGVFFIARNYLDFGHVITELNRLVSIDAHNIILIGLYLILFNSLFEEFFWRGFIYPELKSFGAFKASIISAAGFALVHMMFVYHWLNYMLVIGIFLVLFFFGMLMNHIRDNVGLFSCWVVHMMMDVVMILIALFLFGII